MKLVTKLIVVCACAFIAACSTSDTPTVLTSAIQPQSAPAIEQTGSTAPKNQFVGEPRGPVSANPVFGADEARSAFASDNFLIGPPPKPRTRKTYLINGLASNIENIGYGFTNLSKKIPGSVLHNYASFVESSTIIRSRVTRELKQAYRADPDVEINLVGISFGANIVTIIAQDLGRSNIPVNYLATLDGPAMLPISKNVRKTDNFTCTGLNCFRTDTRMAWGNTKTQKESFRIRSSHIPLANHSVVHARILDMIYAPKQVNATLQ